MKYNLEEGEGVNCFRRVSQVSYALPLLLVENIRNRKLLNKFLICVKSSKRIKQVF